jgi:hypothetical protein
MPAKLLRQDVIGGLVIIAVDKAGRSPAALQKLVESEVARWNPILKAAQ